MDIRPEVGTSFITKFASGSIYDTKLVLKWEFGGANFGIT